MPWSKNVYSSNVQEVAYDEEKKELTITWTRGKRSIYSGVPEELAIDLSNAPSVGRRMVEVVVRDRTQIQWDDAV